MSSSSCFSWLRIGVLSLALLGISGNGLEAQRHARTERSPDREASVSSAAASEDGEPALERPEESLRRRLRKRPAAERARLERHLEEFMGLPKPARAKLLERARALRERERSLREGARPPAPSNKDADEAADESPEGASEEVQRPPAHLREGMKKAGREVRRRIPEDLRGRLERATPEQRRHFLERLARERERLSRKAVETLYARLELTPGEIRRLERMPLSERLLAMRKLERPLPE